MNPHTLLDQLKQRSQFIQGQRVVLEKDVAELYGISVGKLKGIVKRHLAHFPADFMLEENHQVYFTDEGILMVSSVLRTPLADRISVAIVRELFSFNSN
jgi:hypothetical protein